MDSDCSVSVTLIICEEAFSEVLSRGKKVNLLTGASGALGAKTAPPGVGASRNKSVSDRTNSLAVRRDTYQHAPGWRWQPGPQQGMN